MPLERLESRVEKPVMQLVTKAERLAPRGQMGEAIRALHEAWALLPEPRKEQRLAVTVAGGLGDLYCESGDFAKVLEWTQCALECHSGLENPYVHLRLGQALVELGRREAGVDEIVKAHTLGGRKVLRWADPVYGLLLDERLHSIDLSELLPPEYRKRQQ